MFKYLLSESERAEIDASSIFPMLLTKPSFSAQFKIRFTLSQFRLSQKIENYFTLKQEVQKPLE
ncbi:hypothetical protein AKJ41_02485 [candidate division MSBL1 archaeon SCGC-AAA259O05]|uniref:Uncharacterized protein n=1 Tax=candidate division MSBL1 archaeon SCGC-AAA259O05 TaxID=1698271 RepID=A0A133V3Z5_9EURY|nr:hypothetical protein AKJ41_02485 [candidate division MSBL1 archaeon SCGC-AAA259O05]